MKKLLVYFLSIVACILFCETAKAQKINFSNHKIITSSGGNKNLSIRLQFKKIFYFAKQQDETVISKFLFGVESNNTNFPNRLATTNAAAAYDNYYGAASSIVQNAPGSSGRAFPALFNSRGHYIFLTEAGFNENLYGPHLIKI